MLQYLLLIFLSLFYNRHNIYLIYNNWHYVTFSLYNITLYNIFNKLKGPSGLGVIFSIISVNARAHSLCLTSTVRLISLISAPGGRTHVQLELAHTFLGLSVCQALELQRGHTAGFYSPREQTDVGRVACLQRAEQRRNRK